MSNGPRLAIDFGTTRTKVAYYDVNREEAKLIELGIAQREVIPSIFYIPKCDAGDILVGDDAMAQLDLDPNGIVREIKREIDKLGKKRCGIGRLTPTRVELAAKLLRMVRRRCEDGVFHGQIINKCTLTVPVSFSHSQRSKLEEAARLAGFQDILFMDEPTAAARAWIEKQGKRLSDHVVVVDIGGGTTDFSVVEWSNNRFVPHNTVLPEGFAQGGNDIDDRACEEILSQRNQEHEKSLFEVKDSFLVKLRGIKEQFKRGLKAQKISVGSSSIEIQPSVFRTAESEFVDHVCVELKSFLEKCKKSGIELPIVLLVGGASRIHGLIDKLQEICPREVITWESADFATVLGAVEYPNSDSGFVSAKQRIARTSYGEALKAAIADHEVTPQEVLYLRKRREQLGLEETDYRDIETKILNRCLDEIEVPDSSKPRGNADYSMNPSKVHQQLEESVTNRLNRIELNVLSKDVEQVRSLQPGYHDLKKHSRDNEEKLVHKRNEAIAVAQTLLAEGKAKEALLAVKALESTHLDGMQSKLRTKLEQLVEMESELFEMVKNAKTDGMLDPHKTCDLYLKTIDYLRLNPQHTAIVNLLDDMTRLLRKLPVTEMLKLPASVLWELPDGIKNNVSVVNCIGIKLKLIPAGKFVMGDLAGRSDETPHHVTLTKSFGLGVHEVTQEQYQLLMGKNPSQFIGPCNPVDSVLWEDAIEFCQKLSGLPAEKAEGRVYRLPTEAEWEYACRAGSTTKYYFGNKLSQLGEYAWYDENSDKRTHPVSQKEPNAWGLYDMHGNAWEWCSDWYDDYPDRAVTDPGGPVSGWFRVIRGGSWSAGAANCRSALRNRYRPSDFENNLSFRVALSPSEATK